MAMKMKYFVCFAFFVNSVVLSAKLPEGTKTCHKSDPNFNDCLKEAISDGIARFAKGFKPLGVGVIEPVTIPELSADNGGFSQTYKNVEISGISDTKFKKIEIDWDNLEMDIEALTKHSEIKADYTLKGQLLSFPINSAGKSRIVMDEITSVHHIKLERFQKNGKNYLRAISWKIIDKPKSIRYHFDNIVPGNEQLSKTILNTMNENALDVFNELGRPFEEAYGQVHKSVANQVFEKIPEDEIFLP